MYIYLDNASLLPPAPAALDSMRAAAESAWGQPGALHGIGTRARHALEQARRGVAEYAGAEPHEIVFTGSGREALAKAFALALQRVPVEGTIVSSRLEPPSMQALVERAADSGRHVHWLALPQGVPNEHDLQALRAAALVALSICNHELGTTFDSEVPDAIRVIDAVQAAPWIMLDAWNDDRTFYVMSGAKLGAPLGVGVLRVPSTVYFDAVDRNTPIEEDSPPWVTAIALGAACMERRPRREVSLTTARARAARLLSGLREIEPSLMLNGKDSARLGTIVNVSFPGMRGKSLVSALSLEKVCISHTAACQAHDADISPVVRAAYFASPQRAEGATRWSLSEHITDVEVDRALDAAARVLRARRQRA